MRARSAVALAIVLVGTWAVAGPAGALERGVHVDPGSPAGKEYSVPLSLLRGAASGHPGGGGGAGAPTLFGVGISPPGNRPPATRHRARAQASRGTTRAQHTELGAVAGRPQGRQAQARKGSPTGSPSTGTAGTPGTAPSGSGPSDSSALADLTDHGSGAPAVALIAALVVLGGLGLGAVLITGRRRIG